MRHKSIARRRARALPLDYARLNATKESIKTCGLARRAPQRVLRIEFLSIRVNLFLNDVTIDIRKIKFLRFHKHNSADLSALNVRDGNGNEIFSRISTTLQIFTNDKRFFLSLSLSLS